MNRPRRNANKQIQSIRKRDKSGSSHEHEKSIMCMWVVPFPSRTKNAPGFVTCKRKFQVLEESLDHLVGRHIAKLKSSKQPLKCCWEGCLANEREFETVEDLCAHAKIHPEDKLMSFNSSGTLTSRDSDYRDSSDEEYARSKKKRRKGKTSPQVRAKKVQSKSLKVYDRNSQHPRVAIEPSPVQLSFYRFICMWVVPFPSLTKNTPRTVTCKRKFQDLEESLDHLVAHHIAKFKSSKQPLKCCWEGCSANEREFETAEELCIHVNIHA